MRVSFVAGAVTLVACGVNTLPAVTRIDVQPLVTDGGEPPAFSDAGASPEETARVPRRIDASKVVLRAADGGLREGVELHDVLPAGPRNTCPRGYRFWQELHESGCVFVLGPDKKCPGGYRYAPGDRCVSYDASTDVDRADVAAALGGVSLSRCGALEGPDGLGEVWVTFADDGHVMDARVGPRHTGTPVGSCVADALREVRIRPYRRGGPVITSMAFVVVPANTNAEAPPLPSSPFGSSR